MYVCVCNALKEDMVRALAREGYSFSEIQAVTGCAENCGSCHEFAESLVEAEQAQVDRIPILPIRLTA
jgi:bacterioferritin-associated ferredoxin